MIVEPSVTATVVSMVLGWRMLRLVVGLWDLYDRPIELVGWRALTRHCRLMMRGTGIWQWSMALALFFSGGPWLTLAVIGTAFAVWPGFWAPSMWERREPWLPIVDLSDPASIEAFLAEEES